MKHARMTTPTAPWDIPDPAGRAWDHTPAEDAIQTAQNLVGNRVRKPADDLVGRVFMGRLNVSDLDYMAKAILQLADEGFELRRRIELLESELKRSHPDE